MTQPIERKRVMILLCRDDTVVTAIRWAFENGDVWFCVYQHQTNDDEEAEPFFSTKDETGAQRVFWSLVEAHGGPVEFWRTLARSAKTFIKRRTRR